MTLATQRRTAGRKPFQYVEIELDQCRLTYGTAPCTAAIGTTGTDRCYNTRATCQDPDNYDRLAAKAFTTASNRLTKAAALTGVADSKPGTLVVAFKVNTDGTNRYIAHGVAGGTSFEVFLTTANKLRVKADNSAGTAVLDITSSKTFPASSGWHVVLVSWDLANSVAHMYDVDENCIATSGNTLTNANVDWDALTAWTIGAFDSTTLPLDGCMHLLWFAPGQLVDFSKQYNRRRVVSRLGSLVDLGSTGANLTGTAPAVFFKGSATTFNTNNGTGGAFTANTNADCGGLTSFLTGTKQTIRFCPNMAELPKELQAFPFLEAVRITPPRLKPDDAIGERASVSVTLVDAPHHDRGIDPYVSLRAYNPFTQGTFFSKLQARSPYYLGRTLRVRSGYVTGDPATYDASNFETRTYIIDKIDGPDAGGRVTITAKDPLKMADDDRVQIPAPTKARLSAGLTSSATSFTILPSGAGNAYFARTGYVRIDSEVIRFSRVDDTFTVVDTDYTTTSTNGRGRFNTIAAAHDADAAVQECYSLAADSGKNATELVYDWLTAAGVDPGLIPKTDWDAEEASFMPSVFSGIITSPMGVHEAIRELAEVAGFYLWWDEVDEQIKLRAIRPTSSASVVLTDAANFIAGSVRAGEDPDRRHSTCVVYFGQFDPTEALDKRANFRGTYVLSSDSGSAAKHGQERIKEIFSRWIPSTGLATAQAVASMVIERFGEIPRTLSFSLDAKDTENVRLGDLFTGLTRFVTDAAGAVRSVTYQAISVAENEQGTKLDYSALQERYDAQEGSIRYVYILGGERDINLRTEHDKSYATPIGGETVRCVVIDSAILGATSSAVPALDIGSWPAGVDITLEVIGRIQGAGGRGGDGASLPGSDGQAGQAGGKAIYTRYPITLIYTNGEIWSGGGGGGGGGNDYGGGGGGGAGTEAGPGGAAGGGLAANGSDSTATSGGSGGAGDLNGGNGGNGGGPGLDGFNATGGSGGGVNGTLGPAGSAIDGWSYVTVSGGAGDLRGPTVN